MLNCKVSDYLLIVSGWKHCCVAIGGDNKWAFEWLNELLGDDYVIGRELSLR
jgi:hypothetical protein